ncbi:MAG: hypothetical protein CVU13_06460 [Bacteroidetes bacterium HGW-Bacteroidetes-8]|jgi:hypothetical protein|nr:MAG: hypothetical protein CVU13_06460 [Bacteroidetes bacterium HGW-Bacteroidetes-8]
MWREIFLKSGLRSVLRQMNFVVRVMAISLYVVVSSCSGFSFIDEGDKEGELRVAFNKAGWSTSAGAYEDGSSDTGLVVLQNGSQSQKATQRSYPDSNSFILTVKRVGGDVVYKGKYGDRPQTFKLSAGNYDVEVVSGSFTTPEFDTPIYSDSGTVVVEEGKVTNLSFLCRQSNGALRLGFSSDFVTRFAGYTPEIEDIKGVRDYVYSESRYLYINPGDVTIKLRGGATTGTDRFLITKKSISAREMVTVNLHSSSNGGGGGSGSGGESSVITGILIDTTSIWITDDIVVGDKRDGSSRELAIRVEEIAGFVGAKGVWVSGYVAGYLTTASLFSSPPFDVETNIAIADKKGESLRSLCAGVALAAGSVREALNLKSNPTNLGKKVWVKGTITDSYFGLKGINSVTDYVIE